MKLSKRVLGLGSAVAVAGTLALTGITGAAASGSSSGFIHVTLMGTNPANNATRTIIVTGAFTAGGIDHSGNKTDNLVFPDGTLTIVHIRTAGTQRFNSTTCLGQIAENGTYVLGGGTGAYKGITGHGIYRANITIVSARDSSGACTNKLPPAAFQFIVRAQGPVSGA
jgi:hypothetical protein